MISYTSVKGIADLFSRLRSVDKFFKGWAWIFYDFYNGQAVLLLFRFIGDNEPVLKWFIYCAKAWKYSIAQKRTPKEKGPCNCNRKEDTEEREYLIRYGLIRIKTSDSRSKKPGKNQQSSGGESSSYPIFEGVEGPEIKINKSFYHTTISAVKISGTTV